VALVMVAGLGWAASARANLGPRVETRTGSTLWLEGKSTLHPYKSTATELRLEAPLASPVDAAGADLVPALMKAISGLRVTVPVAGLRSGKDGLDKNLVKAARAAQHPEITFQLEPQSATAMPSGSGARVTTRGALTVNGTTRQIDVAMDVVPGPEGLVVTGSEELLMSEYGIKPPTMMLGALKTDDKVTVHFRLVLGVESR
jgi:hypothetical protein